MLEIDFQRTDKEAVIQEAKEYIHLLEHSISQLEDALKAECETTNDLYGEKLVLEERITKLEEELTKAQTALSWSNEPTCY